MFLINKNKKKKTKKEKKKKGECSKRIDYNEKYIQEFAQRSDDIQPVNLSKSDFFFCIFVYIFKAERKRELSKIEFNNTKNNEFYLSGLYLSIKLWNIPGYIKINHVFSYTSWKQLKHLRACLSLQIFFRREIFSIISLPVSNSCPYSLFYTRYSERIRRRI